MDWTEIKVKTGRKYSDACAAVLQMASDGIYIEDYFDIEETVSETAYTDLIDGELLKKDREHVIIHVYFSAFENIAEKTGYINERLGAMQIPFEMESSKIQEEDWANNWKQFYKPFSVGERLLVKPQWESAGHTERLVLNIEPGLAFGTGTHETTKMCLELLEECIQGRYKALDIGCGSGILSVAALLLGAGHATAIDIDPIAVRSAVQNGELNGFYSDRLKVINGDLVTRLKEGEKFDIILANIVAEVIIKILPQIPRFLNVSGAFICSGIIDDKLESVKEALENNGLIIEKICMEKGWAAILAKH